jgi:hypothetical protein
MALVMVVQEIMAAMVPETAPVMTELVLRTALVMAVHQGLGLHQIQEMAYLMEAVSRHRHHRVHKVDKLKTVPDYTANVFISTF